MTFKDVPICLNSLLMIVPHQGAKNTVLPNPEHAEFFGGLETLCLPFMLSAWNAPEQFFQLNFLNVSEN